SGDPRKTRRGRPGARSDGVQPGAPWRAAPVALRRYPLCQPLVTSRIRIAIVGCGAVTRASLLPALSGHDGFELLALVDRDLARAQELASLYRVPSALDTMSVLDRNLVDGVVIATPPGHHAIAAQECAAKGLHIFVEKPMAITAADATAMIDAAARAG